MSLGTRSRTTGSQGWKTAVLAPQQGNMARLGGLRLWSASWSQSWV